jgi:EAL domain-containing protein (putative c-di-GMP-specific phosphodiesterase class I)
MSGSTEKQIVVASLVDLAHKLNRSVIAEGVEYKEHVTILKSYNCDFIQGNYISKPLPVHVIEKNRNTYFSETILPME